jgi:hypothetical protein
MRLVDNGEQDQIKKKYEKKSTELPTRNWPWLCVVITYTSPAAER